MTNTSSGKMSPSLCPYLKESRRAGIKGTKEPLLRWSWELITPERIQWLFTHQGIVRCSAGCCQRSGEGEFPIAPQEKICQHVKTIRGCVMTGSADNSLSTCIFFQWRSLWPDVVDWQADTCSVLTCPHMQQLTSSLYGQKNVQVFAVDT